jgi:hypothetical protein
MRKIITMVVAFALIGLGAQGQVKFDKTNTWRIGVGPGTQQTSDGGYIMAGTVFVPVYENDTIFDGDVFRLGVIKTNAYGDTLWTKLIGIGADTNNLNTSWGYAIGQFPDGSYIIVGDNEYLGSTNLSFTKLDSNGNILWAKSSDLHGDGIGISDAIMTTDGKMAMVGTLIIDANNNYEQCFLMVIDTTGNETAGGNYGLASWDNTYLYSIKQTSDGGFIMTGNIYKDTINSIYLLRTDACGNIIWVDNIGGAGGCVSIGYAVQQTNDGGFLVAGRSGCFSSTYTDEYLVKTDSIGNLLWSKIYSDTTTSNAVGSFVYQSTDGGYMIGGDYFVKTDTLGHLIWAKTGLAAGYKTNDGGYIDSGLSKSDSLFSNGCNVISNASPIVITPTPVVTHLFDGGGGCGFDGTFSIAYLVLNYADTITTNCFTTGVINPNSTKPDISLYPNPTTSLLTLSIPNTTQKATINLYDMMGQLIIDNGQLTSTNPTSSGMSIVNYQLSIKNLPQGIYFLEVLMDGEKQVRKVVKMD